MKPEIKQIILKCIEKDLGDAGDNLNRAKRSFKNYPPERMAAKYGLSNDTRQEILDGYQKWHDETTIALSEMKKIEVDNANT